MARFCVVVTLVVYCLVTDSSGSTIDPVPASGWYSRLVAGIQCVCQLYPFGGWYNLWQVYSTDGRYTELLLGGSGGVVNSLDFCPASLKSLGSFYFRCVLSSQ